MRQTTAAQIEGMARRANISITQPIVNQVLAAIRRMRDSTNAKHSVMSKVVSDELEKVGLEAWIDLFVEWLPDRVKSVKLMRQTTLMQIQEMADRMAKANVTTPHGGLILFWST